MQLDSRGSAGSERRRWLIYAAVFGIALVARLTFQIGVVGLNAPPHDDAALYDSIAASLTHGGAYVDSDGYRSRRAPAFPWLLAGVYEIAGHSWPAARMLQAILGSMTCTLLLSLGSGWLGRGIGLTAALACAVLPHAIFWSGSLLTEPLCSFLATASTWALTKTGGDRRWIVPWSVLCSLTALTRPNMGLLFPLGLVWLVRTPGRRWTWIVIAVALFCLTLTPWTVRNYLVHDRFVPITTMGGVVLWQGNNPIVARDPDLRGRSLPGDPSLDESISRLPETDQDRLLFDRALCFMTTSVREMPLLVGRKLLRLWNPFPELDGRFQRWLASLTLAPVFVLLATGLLTAWRNRDGRVLPLLTPVLAVTVTGAVYWADGRIRAPADPVILLVASYGLLSVFERLRHRRAAGVSPSTPLL